MSPLFLVTAVLPTVLAAIYYGLIASDIYISESRFVVRSPQQQAPSSLLGSLASIPGVGSINRSPDDALVIQDYILSRTALAELEKNLHLSNAFRRRGLDFFTHFPWPDWWNDSFEALYRYYPSRVGVDVDSASSVTTLKVSAFTAEDAYRIDEMLLQMSERLANHLNDRAREDTIDFASTVVRDAEQRAKDAALALANYRNQKVVIDPEKQTQLHLEQVAKLESELIAGKAALNGLVIYTPNNPHIPALRSRLEMLQREIDAESSRVTGGSRSLANKATEYERLALERGFADKQLAAALDSLAAARNEARRKMLYLERIAQPSLPDYPVEPRRIRAVVVVFVLGLIVWGILSLLVASIREHMQ